MCWDPEKRETWIREKPAGCKTEADYPFGMPGMEFEEFIVLCCDVSFDAPRKPSAFVQEIDEVKVLDVSREDELPLKAFLWLPEFANLAAPLRKQEGRPGVLLRGRHRGEAR